MKKKYVTPTMECEEFVTNEYVAMCYILINSFGDGHGYEQAPRIHIDGKATWDDCEDADGFYYYIDGAKEQWCYSGPVRIPGWDLTSGLPPATQYGTSTDDTDYHNHVGYALQSKPIEEDSNAS